MQRGCQVCVICNSNSFHSFIFKLCIMIVHTLKMCTIFFVYISWLFFSFLGVFNLDIFFSKMLRRCLVCVICTPKLTYLNIQTLHDDYTYIEHVHLLFCAHLINIFLLFRSVELRYYIHPKYLGGVWFVLYVTSSFHSFVFKLYTLWLLTHCVHSIFCAHLIIFLGLLNIITSTPPFECLHWLFVCNL